MSELVDFLETVSGSALENPEDEVAQNNALEILSEIQTFLLSATLDQVFFIFLSV